MKMEGSESRIKSDIEDYKAIPGTNLLWYIWDLFILLVYLFDYYQLVGR